MVFSWFISFDDPLNMDQRIFPCLPEKRDFYQINKQQLEKVKRRIT